MSSVKGNRMSSVPRIAFFSDSFHEVNGVAHTSRQFEAYARGHQRPLFSVHAGPCTRMIQDGNVVMCDLQRSGASMNLQSHSELSFDFLLWRHMPELRDSL